jgi:hypothetical protein
MTHWNSSRLWLLCRRGPGRISRFEWIGLLALLALILIPATASHAQAIHGSINGTITDSTGAAVANATITVIDVNKGVEHVEKSNVTGAYYVHDLIPDPYTVKVEAPDFETAKSATLIVAADSAVLFDVRLQVGAAAQTVEVTTVAPQLTTDRAEVATNLDTRTLVEMPNIDRNITALVYLAPGTAPGYFTNAPAEDPMRSVMVSANGQRPQSAGFILDGADDKDGFIGEIVLNPPLDSIEESKFISQDYDPEFGASVAGVTVMQTKSGSNQFHGSAYEFRHSDANLARDPFTQYPGSGGINPDIPHTMYNKYGGSLGGPILKDRLFFFADYQGTRSKQGNSMQLTVPTARVQNTCGVAGQTYCDLSQYLASNANYQAYKPFTGSTTTVNGVTYYTGNGNQTYAGNLIPNMDLNNAGSKAAIAFMNLVPKPNVNVTSDPVINNFLASGSGIYNFNQYDVRIDDQIKDKVHLFGRWGYLGSTQGSPGAFGKAGGPGFGAGGWAGTETGDNQSMAIGADIPIHPNLLTDIRFGWMHYAFVSAKYDAQDPLMTSLGWAGLNTLTDDAGGASAVYFNDDNTGLSSWGTSNGGGLHCNCPLDETQNEYQIVNNWTHDVGRHSIKFGGDARMLRQLRIPSDDNRTGEFTFYADQSSNPTPPSGQKSGGLALATYLFGNPGQMVRYYSTSTNAMDIQPRLFFYAQDTWRITEKLTLSLGGRWEIIWPEHTNKPGNGGFWNWDTDMIQASGIGQVNLQSNVLNNYSYLEPRIGLAYQVTPKSVFRAGVGRDADPGFWGDTFGQLLTQTIPVLQAQSFGPGDGLLTDAARNPSNNSIYNIANAPDAPSTITVPASGMFLLPVGQAPRTRSNRITMPDVYGWNATYQWQMTSKMALSAAYVGSKTTHAVPSDGWAGYNVDDAPMYGYQQHLTCNADQFYLRFGQLYPGVTNCGQWQANMTGSANAHYNAIQLVLDKRYSRGLQFQTSYSYSHATGETGANQFINDPHIYWGEFGYNRRSWFKLYGGYDLPFGKGRQFASAVNPIVDNIIGGFTLNGTLNLASGLPYTATFGTGCYSNVAFGDPTGVCFPNKAGNLSTNVGSLNTSGHYISYFTPVTFKDNGDTEGPWQFPAPYTWGNNGAANLFGPRMFTTDATLRKSITLHEEMRLAVEVDARNVFNHVNLQNPNSCVDCSNGGQITDIVGGAVSSLGGMRQLEFGAHLTF